MDALNRLLSPLVSHLAGPPEEDWTALWLDAALPLPRDASIVAAPGSKESRAIEHFLKSWQRERRGPRLIGETSLHFAAREGYSFMIGLLVACGAQLEAREETGGTALHSAVENGDPATVTALVDAGAQIDAADFEGWTPLHHAACAGNEIIASLLVSRGASLDREGREGLSPREFCAPELRRKLEAIESSMLDLDPARAGTRPAHDTAIATIERWAALSRTRTASSSLDSERAARKAKSPRESESDSEADPHSAPAARRMRR